jgi:hypothetical protein
VAVAVLFMRSPVVVVPSLLILRETVFPCLLLQPSGRQSLGFATPVRAASGDFVKREHKVRHYAAIGPTLNVHMKHPVRHFRGGRDPLQINLVSDSVLIRGKSNFWRNSAKAKVVIHG